MTEHNGYTWSGQVPLRWRDLDAYGHVYYGQYLTLLDEARVAMLKAALDGADPSFVMARVELDYRRQVVIDDGPLSALVRVERVGRTSLTLHEQLSSRHGATVAEARVVVVLYDLDARRPREVSEAERAALSG